MRRSRVLTAFSLAAAVSLLPAACSTAESLDTGSGEPIVIDVWLADYPFPDYLAPRMELAEAFNEAHPEYQINITAHDFFTMPEEVERAVEQGDPPDVANYYYNTAQIARDAVNADGEPLFTSVAEAIGGRQEILGEPVVLDELIPAAREYYAYEGDVVSMPATAMTSLVYANTTLLDAAGVDGVPQTWDEIGRACEAIAELSDGPPHCITWPNHSWFFQQALAQQGGLVADNDNGRSGRAENVDLASDEMMDFVAWWHGLAQEGHYLYTGSQSDWGGAFEAFLGQQVAFTFDSANQGGTLAHMGAEAGFEVEAGRLPYNDAAPYAGTLVTGDSLWLANGLDEAAQDGALAFMQYLHNTENAAEWHRRSSYLPMTESSIDLLGEEGWFDQNAAPGLAIEQMRSSDVSPEGLGAVLGDFDGIQNVMTQAMEDVLTSDADPAERFAEATEEAQALLDAYNGNCVGSGSRGPDCLRVGAFG